MMTQWMEMVFHSSLRLLENILRDAACAVTASDVAGAKLQVKAELQEHKRLPGTLRRWLCHEVDRIEAVDVSTFRRKLAEESDWLT
jgi:hypothetical protein